MLLGEEKESSGFIHDSLKQAVDDGGDKSHGLLGDREVRFGLFHHSEDVGCEGSHVSAFAFLLLELGLRVTSCLLLTLRYRHDSLSGSYTRFMSAFR